MLYSAMVFSFSCLINDIITDNSLHIVCTSYGKSDFIYKRTIHIFIEKNLSILELNIR